MVDLASRPAAPSQPGGHQRRRKKNAFGAVGRKAVKIAKRPAAAAGTTGRGVGMAVNVIRYAITDTLTFRLPVGEFLWQSWALFKVTATPALLMAIPIGGIVTVIVSGLVAQVGATALLGAASGVGVLREGAPVTAGLLMGALRRRPSRRTSGHAPFARNSTRCGCWESTPSVGWWCRASWR